MVKNQWNAALYEGKHAFVWQYGTDVLELLAPQPGEYILDLGCGTGQLTDAIAQSGAQVVGMDAAASMIEKASQNYPALQFAIADARHFEIDHPLDAVFSNATLHWILEPDTVIQSVYRSLKPSGRFVAEMGGNGNVDSVVQALYVALKALGYDNPAVRNPWYFPSVGEYATRLEQGGFEVIYAVLFDRPVTLDGTEGVANWLQMFASPLLAGLSAEQQHDVIRSVEDQLRPTRYQNNAWSIDYRRLRFVAIKRSIG
jgi:trans-aconitate 2-methyltransferase